MCSGARPCSSHFDGSTTTLSTFGKSNWHCHSLCNAPGQKMEFWASSVKPKHAVHISDPGWRSLPEVAASLYFSTPKITQACLSVYPPSRRHPQLSSCTAAMAGNFSRSFWVTATRTVMTLAAGPVMRTFTIGPEISTSSRPPPPVPAQDAARHAPAQHLSSR